MTIKIISMKKILNIVWCLFIAFAWTGCYKDLGNYSYHEINDLTVEGLEPQYDRDVDDSLIIQPVLKGTQYSDTARFSYEWEIQGVKVAETHDLRMQVNLTPGMKYSRFIVKDKETGIKNYSSFNLKVSSSTAGDLIMVLSKYQGRAELSYLRLDKPANWAVNYYKDRYEEELGKNPQQLNISYLQSWSHYPFVNNYGRIMILVDDEIKLFDKSSLVQDSVTPILTQDAYTGLAVYPKPEIDAYEPQFLNEGIGQWRFSPYGALYSDATEVQISAGTLFYARIGTWANAYGFDEKCPNEGYLAPFGYWDEMSDTEDKGANINLGYATGDFIMFDKNSDVFVYFDGYRGIYSIDKELIKPFPGYTLMWGSATNRPNSTSIAVLNNGDLCEMVLLQNYQPDKGRTTKKLIGEMNAGPTMNAGTKCYMMKYNDYLLYSTGNKLYRYNIMDIVSHTSPNKGNMIVDLSELGYDAQAKITDFCVSRTEQTLLLGVSRYGEDSEATGEEAKGDILYFDLDKTTAMVKYNAEKSHKGVAGIPVDVQIKYQTHYRNGIDKNKILQDNI